MTKFTKILLLLSIFQSGLEAQTEFDHPKLTDEEKISMARLHSKFFFNSVNMLIKMGRSKQSVSAAQKEIDVIMFQFDDYATIEESYCKNSKPHVGRPKPIDAYLLRQYYKAREKYFTIEFEDLGVEPIPGKADEYTVLTKFRQVYDSKYYSDVTVKGIVIKFKPDNRGVPTPKIKKIIVLQTECEPPIKSKH